MRSICFITAESNIQFHTETKPIINRFPKLEKVNKVYWNANVIGESSFGPSTYKMQGYVELDHYVAQKFEDAYDWSSVSFNPAMQSQYDHMKHRWSYSEEFDQYIKPSNYVGKFYFDSYNGLIYFDVEK